MIVFTLGTDPCDYGFLVRVNFSTMVISQQGEADFRVLDESEDYIVVSKPAHLLIHPSKPGGPTTLFHGLHTLLNFEMATGGQISIINRIDRETSGVVLIAKTSAMARTFSKAMMRREFDKRYFALVWGWPEESRFVIDAPILRQGEVRESAVFVKQCVHPDGKACKTSVEVLQRFRAPGEVGEGKLRTDRFALLECTPHTGRMHQIRVHLAQAGFPIVGDKIYGPDPQLYLDFIDGGWTPDLAVRLLLDRHALHSAYFAWAGEGMEWSSPLPADLREWMVAHGGDLAALPRGIL